MTNGRAGRKTKKQSTRSDAGTRAASGTDSDWESRVLERIAGHVEAVVPGEGKEIEASGYGWEEPSLSRLARHLRGRRRK